MKRFRRTTAAALEAVLLLSAVACGGNAGPTENHADPHDNHRDDGPKAGAVVRMSEETTDRLGLTMAVAGPGELEVTTSLPGEVHIDGDRMAHVSPRVGGVVRAVRASLGDAVRGGDVMAILESRDLADAKASFLAAVERLDLADAAFDREEQLWRDRVSSEQDFLDARRDRAEARIAFRSAGQKLQALGIPASELDQLPIQHDARLTEYVLKAPFDGTVVDRHITIGESITAGTSVFTVADLTTVWIDLSVYQKDIGSVRAGQTVLVETPHGEEVELEIAFVQPLVGEDTRTAMARVIAPNSDGVWHPGCFVTAEVATTSARVRILVPQSAVITMDDGDPVVFVATDGGYAARPVTLGNRSRDHFEVTSGLDTGEHYVASGGFSLKAELGKDAFGDGHGH